MKNKECAICGIPLNGFPILRFENVHFMRCDTCEGWTYFPRSNSHEQEAFHDTFEYFNIPYFVLRRQAQRSSDRRCENTFRRIRAAVSLENLSGIRLLDVGCDTGTFLVSAARLFGITPIGIDVSQRALKIAASRGIEVYHTNLEQAPEHLTNFTIITAIDLIEHVFSPKAFLRQVFSRLQPGGIVYLETPNISSCIYQTSQILCHLTKGQPRSIFTRLFPPEHVQYFTRQSLELLGRECGFELICLQSRTLPFRDISTPLLIRIGVSFLQLPDMVTNQKALLWGIFRKPVN